MKSTKRFRAALAAVLVLALSPLFSGAALAEDSSATTYSGNKTAVTDPSTIWDWQGLIENDTSSVGRIWTDKTVSDNEISKNGVTISKENGADFLTALTALSSTSNLSNTATTPLDIVLVLDASGSMSDAMGSGDTTKRIDALKSAANSFIDEIAKQNATVKDEAKQHQVAIVKFAGEGTGKVGNDTYWSGGFEYNYSQVMKTLAPCTNDTKSAFSSQVNAIRPAGATNAAAGLELAMGQTSKRTDAKKIVIFFTDGKPTTQSKFDPGVASSAVGHAKNMKDAGAAVYSIGIFQGADPAKYPDPQRVYDENNFMHAVSSNYPSATYTKAGEWNFGDRAKDSDGKDATFYKSATNADELKHVFDDISKEISKGSGYPTKTSEGFEHETGYITFDDQLGDYMQVTDLSKLVYNGKVYDCESKTTVGNVDTYHFSGDVHSGLADADLKDVVIKVTRSDDAAVGDKVQVKVPASLIPLRNFAIDLAKGTMSVSNTTPISVLYSSGVKPAALDLLENPDGAMKTYMEKNTDAAGKVNFYANKWTGKETGDAVATFQPATGNSYYYFTQDTPIYTDEACTTPAKSVKSGSTYYYKHDYYAMENGKPVAKTEHVSFPGDVAEQAEGVIAKDSTGACYFKSGMPRLTYINELHKVKEKNRTATAADVLNPKWSGTGQSAAQTQINAYLGNNGKLSMDVPGTLTVTKQLKLPDGYNAADFANEKFEFTIAMQDAVGKSFNAVVKNANGEQQGDKFVLAFGQDGQAKHSLKPGETLYVYGLSAGWDYKVSETPRDGFKAEAAGAEGQIAAGQTSAVTYKNTYSASGKLDGEKYLKGKKVLTGREWLETDKFTFILKDADTSIEAPMPSPPANTLGETHVEVTQPLGTPAGTEVPFNFQGISYAKPGTYTYEIWESEELSTLNSGVSASQALYQVVVAVTDESHNGTLTVKSKMTKLFDDDGVKCEELIESNTASFVNEYDTSEVKWTPSGTKTYTDTTGGNPLKPDMFHVIVCTNNAKAPLPEGEGVTRVNRGEWRGVLTTVEAGGSIAWPSAKYEHKDLDPDTLDATFEYKIVEVVKVGDTWRAVKDVLADKTFDPAGMVYDQTVWTAKVTVADKGGPLELSVEYKDDSGTPITGSMFGFDNSYKPDPAELKGDTAIRGTKVLTGRDMAKDETFGFKLSAADEATQKAIDAGNIVIPQGADEAVVSGAKAGVEKTFSFGEMTFSKPGTYSFAVQEDKYCDNDLDAAGAATGGIVFDRHVHKVTVKVTDNHSGTLSAAVSYDNGPAKFENKYEQNTQFSGITVQKTLNGRNMAADEFSFSIYGVKSDTVSAEDADARLADSDRSFTNAARADGIACDMAKIQGVTFTQDDIGKTFAYEVREVVPAAADAKPGVTYDDSMHTLEITVGMSGDVDKHLTLTTKLDGEVIDPAKKSVAFVNGYQATPTSYDTATAGLSKVLEGRDWIDSDEFTFELKALDGGPLPKDSADNDVTTVTVTKANAESFGFGAITFTSDMVKAEPDHKRTFTYEVREVVPTDGHKLPGIQYDDNVATIKVTVSDDGSGLLKASAVAENTRFVNRYAAEIDYTAAGGLNVAKTLTGRDMAEGQFTIKVTPGDEASAYALGLPLEGAEIAMPAAADGVQAVKSALGEQHVVLRQSDVGKTYTYKVVEVVGEKVTGYTYDTTEYTVTVTVEDNPEQAALTVKTVVAGGPEGAKTYVYGADPSAAGTGHAVVPFANAYTASTDNPGGTAAQVTATKALTGRPLSADEFTFAVKYATGGDDLRTAKNAADGTATFDGLHYTTEMLEGLVKDGSASKTSDKGVTSWTVSYLAYEKTDGLADQGITAQTQPIPFRVTVVDNGDGSLTATANLDKGLKFENTYSTGDPVQVGLSGVKTLQAAPGLAPASIEGKFTFTVTSDDAAAPMPEFTKAKNEADGSVDFGTIEFTLNDLNRALGVNDQTATAGADKAEADAAKAADQAAAPAKETDA
ncbi:MAG: FctA domain-containing protein, partial [Coriobacteriia bacterium]|nr:FctA domain-containing protein [Coriobacteriia bacterium]